MSIMSPLAAAQRRFLKARAHHLDPVIRIGQAGLTPAVLRELERNLKHHELVKVKAAGIGQTDRTALLEDLCARLDAPPVQIIGAILVLYRAAKDARLILPNH